MELFCVAEVVRDSQEEGLVLRQLGDRALRVVIELVIVVQLGEERLQAALLRERGHAKEERPGVLILRDRLEPLDVLLQETEHLGPNDRPGSLGTG
jgi:hypothetical protein